MRKLPAFTLVEYLLYVAILSVFMISATTVIVSIFSGKARTEAVLETEQNARAAIYLIETTVRNAQAILVPAVGTSSTYLTLTKDNITTTFALRDQAIEIKQGDAASSTLTGSGVRISNLQFRNLGGATSPAAIRIQFTVSSSNPGNNPDYNYGQVYYGSAVLRKRL